MWKDHFEQLYNSISDNNARDRFYERIIYSDVDSTQFVIAVKNVIEACKKQKKNKAAGLDGVHMEAFIYGSDQLLSTFAYCLLRIVTSHKNLCRP